MKNKLWWISDCWSWNGITFSTENRSRYEII